MSPNTFDLSPVSNEKIIEMLSSLSTNKATGMDHIPARFLKDSGNVIGEVIAHIIHLSIQLVRFQLR